MLHFEHFIIFLGMWIHLHFHKWYISRDVNKFTTNHHLKL